MFDICAMIGLFSVTCSHCKTPSKTDNRRWRCRSCGSNTATRSYYDHVSKKTVVVEEVWQSPPPERKVTCPHCKQTHTVTL